jgi:hypothetical protein
MSGASAAQRAIRAARSGETSVISLQELHGLLSESPIAEVETESSPAEAERGG